jgi:hypothetical protein
MKKLALACLAVFAVYGCSSTGGDSGSMSSSGSDDVAGLIKSAEAAIKKAAAADGEWRDSKSKFIKTAKAALAKGDTAAAMKAAEMAKFEGEMGEKQAMAEKNAKPWLF